MDAKKLGLILLQCDETYKVRVSGILHHPFQHANIRDVDINSETKVVTLKIRNE